MKKIIIPIVVLIAIIFAVYFLVYKKSEGSHAKTAPVTVNTSDSLTGSTGIALQAYYNMKDAFIKSDTALVNSNANEFVTRLGAMQLADIKADSSVVGLAMQLKETIATETKNIIAASGIENKRKAFQVVSDGLFDFLRTIGYKGSKVYQQFCPMAFNNTGAAWLSNSTEIVNPYYGEKMLHCGDLRDSVNIQP